MTLETDELPSDPEALKALILAERAQHAARLQEIENERDRLRGIIQALQRHRFGRRSEQLDPDQLDLALEDLEQMLAAYDAGEDRDKKTARSTSARRKTNRGALPAHLPRVETVVDIPDRRCPCCTEEMHRIGEDVAERLDVIPAQFRVLVTRRPKYACRRCVGTVVQAPAPARLVEGGLPTEALVAHVIVAKYADHLPLYRQAQAYARSGIDLDRSTLADWVGRAAWYLRPLHERLLDNLRRSPKLFTDETTAPVLFPGRGRTRPASSGPMPKTTDHGAGRNRRRSPMSMPLTARPSVQQRTSKASVACCRWMATPGTGRSPYRHRPSRLLLGTRPSLLL